MKGIIITVVIISSLFLGMRSDAQGEESSDLELVVADYAASDSLYMSINKGDDCAKTLARLIHKGHMIREIHGSQSQFQSLSAVEALARRDTGIIFYSLTAYWPPTSVVLTCGLFSECNDELDNDSDGEVDCGDEDCADSPFCGVAR